MLEAADAEDTRCRGRTSAALATARAAYPIDEQVAHLFLAKLAAPADAKAIDAELRDRLGAIAKGRVIFDKVSRVGTTVQVEFPYLEPYDVDRDIAPNAPAAARRGSCSRRAEISVRATGQRPAPGSDGTEREATGSDRALGNWWEMGGERATDAPSPIAARLRATRAAVWRLDANARRHCHTQAIQNRCVGRMHRGPPSEATRMTPHSTTQLSMRTSPAHPAASRASTALAVSSMPSTRWVCCAFLTK
jgi:hypothetical protein